MKIEILTDKNTDEYEFFVNSQENSLIHYSIKYRNFLSSIIGCESHYLIARLGEKIQGILPLMIKNGPLGKVLNSLPFFGSHGGILSKNELATNLLLDHYSKFVKSENFSSSTIILNPFEPQSLYSGIFFNERDYRVGQITFFEKKYLSLEQLFEKFHSKTRNMVRKAIKNRIEVEIDNNQCDFLMKTHIENISRLNGTFKQKSFFENLNIFFKEGIDYNIYVAKINGRIISALLLFYFNGTVEYFMPVVDFEYKNLQPLSLIICKAMIDSIENGFKKWNWGGTWKEQSGVYRFKSRFGAKDFKYSYLINVANKELYNVKREYLLKHYQGFYVLPFNKLKVI